MFRSGHKHAQSNKRTLIRKNYSQKHEGGFFMKFVNFLANQRDKRREQMREAGTCPDCLGKRFHHIGLYFVHVYECPSCQGKEDM
jgi:hypothetical protein